MARCSFPTERAGNRKHGLEAVRSIRDEIDRRVQDLLIELTAPSTPATR